MSLSIIYEYKTEEQAYMFFLLSLAFCILIFRASFVFRRAPVTGITATVTITSPSQTFSFLLESHADMRWIGGEVPDAHKFTPNSQTDLTITFSENIYAPKVSDGIRFVSCNSKVIPKKGNH